MVKIIPVKPVSWKNICLKLFSLEKIRKKKAFVQKESAEVSLKKVFLKHFTKFKGKHLY